MKRLRAGKTIDKITVHVIDDDGEVILRVDLFDQDVGAVPLEGVVRPVEGDVVRVSETTADTCSRYTNTTIQFYTTGSSI